MGTGDAFRTAGMKNVEYLLDHDVRVALVYGDRDVRSKDVTDGQELTATDTSRSIDALGFLVNKHRFR